MMIILWIGVFSLLCFLLVLLAIQWDNAMYGPTIPMDDNEINYPIGAPYIDRDRSLEQ